MLFRKTFLCVRLILKDVSSVLCWIMPFGINLENTAKEVDFVFSSFLNSEAKPYVEIEFLVLSILVHRLRQTGTAVRDCSIGCQ